ncbi:MAG: flagellar hook capping FlgD N-terminal domain-containing protein [Planctomycetota bacterium]
MTTSAIGGSNGAGALGDMATSSAYRDADFMTIMLAEITKQDPLEPADTSELVKGMQQMQDLANARYEKFRADVGWAQNLMGQDVIVGQVALGEKELSALQERGLNPDTGFGTVQGPVSHFRSIEEQVWVSIGDHDYPIDNIQQVQPQRHDEAYFADIANSMLGHEVGYLDDNGELQLGVVDEVSWNGNNVIMRIGDQAVGFDRLRSIARSGG